MANRTIIDVSYHNGDINWDKVKASGLVDGVIIRCGYGQDMESQDDKKFKEYADACTRLGIPFGTYLYSYAKNTTMAESEARHALRVIQGYKLDLPVFFDSEQPGTESVANNNALAFMKIIADSGYKVGIYASESWYKSYMSGIKDCPLWIAKYGSNDGQAHTKPSIDNIYAWQYTSRGTVDGIKAGSLDMSILYDDSAINVTPSTQTVTPTPTPTPQAKPVDESWKGDKSIYLENGYVESWQHAMNVGFDLEGADRLSCDGKWGRDSQAFASNHNLWKGQTHNCPTAIKWLRTMLREVYGFNKVDDIGKWTDYLTTCVKTFQRNRGLKEDGIVGKTTTYWLLSGKKM